MAVSVGRPRLSRHCLSAAAEAPFPAPAFPAAPDPSPAPPPPFACAGARDLEHDGGVGGGGGVVRPEPQRPRVHCRAVAAGQGRRLVSLTQTGGRARATRRIQRPLGGPGAPGGPALATMAPASRRGPCRYPRPTASGQGRPAVAALAALILRPCHYPHISADPVSGKDAVRPLPVSAARAPRDHTPRPRRPLEPPSNPPPPPPHPRLAPAACSSCIIRSASPQCFRSTSPTCPPPARRDGSQQSTCPPAAPPSTSRPAARRAAGRARAGTTARGAS